jgi:hypothetical protein
MKQPQQENRFSGGSLFNKQNAVSELAALFFPLQLDTYVSKTQKPDSSEATTSEFEFTAVKETNSVSGAKVFA